MTSIYYIVIIVSQACGCSKSLKSRKLWQRFSHHVYVRLILILDHVYFIVISVVSKFLATSDADSSCLVPGTIPEAQEKPV